jgi:hypothetical protein
MPRPWSTFIDEGSGVWRDHRDFGALTEAVDDALSRAGVLGASIVLAIPSHMVSVAIEIEGGSRQ